MSKPRKLYHDDIIWIPKSAYDKAIRALKDISHVYMRGFGWDPDCPKVDAPSVASDMLKELEEK